MHEQLIPKFKEVVDRYSKNYKITDSEKFVKIIIKDIGPRSNAPEHQKDIAKNDALTQDLLDTFRPYGSSGLRYSHNSQKKATTYIVHFRKAWQQADNQDWIKQNDIVYDSEGADVDVSGVLDNVMKGKYSKREEVKGVYKVFNGESYLGRIYYLAENPMISGIHQIKDDNIRRILRYQEIRIRLLEDIFMPGKYTDKYKSSSVKRFTDNKKNNL